VLDGLGGSLKRLLAAICAVSSSAGCWCSGGAVPLLAISRCYMLSLCRAGLLTEAASLVYAQ